MSEVKINELTEKLRWSEKIGYGLGDFAGNLMWQSVLLYLTIFYTDVVGLSPVAVSILFLVARIWDAINDPIMGAIVDKTNTKDGKCRPWFKWCIIPVLVAPPLCFFSPDISDGGKLAFAYVTYIALGVIFTAFNTPYCALVTAMTKNPQERATLASIRMIGSQAGVLLVSAVVPIVLVQFTTSGLSQASAYSASMIVFGVLGAILLYSCFKLTKERYSQPGAAKLDRKLLLAGIVKNKPLLILCLVFLFFQAILALTSAGYSYMFTYVFGDVGSMATFNTLAAVATIIGLLLVPTFNKFVDRKTIFIIGSIGMLILPVYFYFCTPGPESVNTAIVIRIIQGFFWAGVFGTSWSFIPDTVEYGELISGNRTEGLNAAIVGFFFKLGITVAGFVPGIILEMVDYVPNQEQTPEAIQGIITMNSTIPIIMIVCMLALIIIYPLNDKRCREIVVELEEKKQKEAKGE